MALSDETESLSYEAAFDLASVYSPDCPLDELGELALAAGDKARAMAAIVLLADADVDAYYHNLIRSALARDHYLMRCLREGETHHRFFCAGHVGPVLDAIAAGQFPLASHIDSLTPNNFREGIEYEDEFCFAKLLGQLASDTLDAARCAELLDQLETYLDGDNLGRWLVCKALVERDTDALTEALEERLTERESEIERDKEQHQLVTILAKTERPLFIEGLAIYQLAAKRGIPLPYEQRMCPSLALLPMQRPFPGE